MNTRSVAGPTALVVAVVVALLVAGSSGATSPPQEGRRHYRLTAVLKPELVVKRPVGTRSDTAGRISLKVDRNYKGGHVIRPQVVFEGLTGPPVTIHIHAGRPGSSGRVVHTLCGTTDPALRCKQFHGGTFIWSIVPFFDPALVGPAYIDVHTKRNPQGELRGQVTTTPLG